MTFNLPEAVTGGVEIAVSEEQKDGQIYLLISQPGNVSHFGMKPEMAEKLGTALLEAVKIGKATELEALL